MYGFRRARLQRVFEPPKLEVGFDDAAARIIADASVDGPIRLVAVEPGSEMPDHDRMAILIEVTGTPARDTTLLVHGEMLCGYPILKLKSHTAGPAIAAAMIGIRDRTGQAPHIDFSWPQRSNPRHLLRFALSGSGHVAPVTREILRRAEPDASRRPAVHVG